MTEPFRPVWKSPMAWLPLLLLVGVYVLYHQYTDHLDATIDRTQAELKHATKQLAFATDANSEAAVAAQRATEEIAALRAEHTASIDQLTQAHEQRIAGLSTEHNAARKTLEETHARQLAQLTQSHQTAIADYEQRLAEAANAAAEQAARVEAAQAAQAELTARLEVMTASGIAVEAKLAANEETRRELQAKLDADNDTIARINAEINSATQNEAAMRDKVARAVAMHADATTLLKTEEAAIEELKRRLVDATEARGTLEAQLQTELGLDPQGLEQLQRRAADNEQQLATLASERDAAGAERDRLTVALEEQRAAAEQTSARLTATDAALTEARAALADAGDKDATTRDLAVRLKTAETARDQASEAKAAAETARDQANAALAAARTAHDEALGTRERESAAKLAELTAQVGQLGGDLARARQDLKAQTEQQAAALAAASDANATYEQRLAETGRALAAAEAQLAERTQALAAQQAEGGSVAEIRRFYQEVNAIGGRVTAEGVQVILSGEELRFPPGTATLPDGELPTLSTIATLLREHPALSARIEGHTDSSGNPETNRALSEQRAQAVRAALIESDIDGARLTASGLGAGRPLTSNASAEGRQRNRRVEVYLVEPEARP